MIAQILVSIWSSLRECIQQDTMQSIVSKGYYCSWLSESFSKCSQRPSWAKLVFHRGFFFLFLSNNINAVSGSVIQDGKILSQEHVKYLSLQILSKVSETCLLHCSAHWHVHCIENVQLLDLLSPYRRLNRSLGGPLLFRIYRYLQTSP